MCWNSIDKIKFKKSTVVKTIDTGEIVPPKEGNIWSGKNFFLEKLFALEDYLASKKGDIYKMIPVKCSLCSRKGISTIAYIHKNFIWTDGLKHYVSRHNIKPSSKFIRFVLNNDPNAMCGEHGTQNTTGKTSVAKTKSKKLSVTLNGKLKKINEFSYVKLKANQLMILDALMEHGGITPKYKEKHEAGFKYSEHAGMLEFSDNELERIIISGKTSRTNENDPEIYFPLMGEKAYNYEYIFHTHPSTPAPGGRIKENILYEFPSVNDIFHFAEHWNYGKVNGSIVVAPEGMYNIRQLTYSKRRIALQNVFGIMLKHTFQMVQTDAINKFSNIFKKNYPQKLNQDERQKLFNEFFYSVIAQDTTAIDICNKQLNMENLHIDYFPRQKSKNGHWNIGTIYIPLCHA